MRSSSGLRLLCILANLSLLAAALSAAQQPNPVRADSILILKKDHLMQLLVSGKVIRTYKVVLGQGGLAPKEREGDARTPEGHYTIDSRNATSAYHKALHISYPSPDDRKRAARLGVSPGGAVMIHGLPNGKGWVVPPTASTTGPWAVSPSPTRKSTRSGTSSPPAPPSKSAPSAIDPRSLISNS